MRPRRVRHRERLALFQSQLDGAVDHFRRALGEVDVEVDVHVAGEMSENVLENRNRGNAIRRELVGSAEHRRPEVARDPGDQLALGRDDNLVHSRGASQDLNAKADQRLSREGQEVFVGQTLAAQPGDDRADDVHGPTVSPQGAHGNPGDDCPEP